MSITRSTLSETELELLAGPLAVQVSTVDSLQRPQVSRGWSAQIDEAGVLTVVLLDAQSTALQGALLSSRRAAVNVTHPVTLHSLQFKGELVAIAEPSDSARALATRSIEEFSQAVRLLGLDPTRLRGLAHPGSARYVSVQAREMFDQRPGPRAGQPLRSA